ncbi:MAG: phosphotransferase family protein [Actinomycetota bacterium]|nr:phosphotransferase family protein [Actinomycetota bacterium]
MTTESTDHRPTGDQPTGDQPSGDQPVDGVDRVRLLEFLSTQLPGLTEPITATLLTGGRSNLSYAVTTGDHNWVLRRPPPGQLLATAHDMHREYRVITALAGSAVPVPGAVLFCQDEAVIGAPFYLMQRMPGVAIRDLNKLESMGPETVNGLIFRLVDILAQLHAVDPNSVGLNDFGRPAGYNERQLRRWSRQLAASMTGDIPGLAELIDALGVAVPPTTGAAIVHGDYRLDNVLIDRPEPDRPPVVTAVLDWEMSTLGDPLGDLALMLLYARRALPDADGRVPRSAVSVAGHPTEEQLIQRYVAGSGRDVSGLSWFQAFACFKLAAILQGVHFRYLRGSYGRQSGFAGIGDAVAPLVADGRNILKGS